MNRRVDFLDALRGLAILAVFVYHSLSPAFGRDSFPWKHWLPDVWSARSLLYVLPTTFGWTGVPVFFAISGFCIHLAFAARPSWADFWKRRFFRIYPPYFVALVAFAFLLPTTRLAGPERADLVPFVEHAALVHNYDERHFFAISPAFWSIAVEAQLYLLYPALVFAVRRWGWRRFLPVVAGIEIVIHLADGLSLAAGGTGIPSWIRHSPLAYWCGWSSGAYVADCHLRGRVPAVSGRFLRGLAIAAFVCAAFRPLAPLRFLLVTLWASAFIARRLAPGAPAPRVPEWLRRHLDLAGRWSYSLYLLHQPLLALVPPLAAGLFGVARLHPNLVFLACVGSWPAFVALAGIFHHLVERPSLALGRRATEGILTTKNT